MAATPALQTPVRELVRQHSRCLASMGHSPKTGFWPYRGDKIQFEGQRLFNRQAM